LQHFGRHFVVETDSACPNEARVARLSRYFLPDQPLHVIQRGNNRQAIFFCEDDYGRLHAWLAEAAAADDCAVHAYVLMTNHLHLLVTPGNEKSLPRTMQALGRRYVRHVNTARRRTGTLWEGRYRAAPIDSDAYFFACCRYIELNPVRAGMVSHPSDYVWSSFRAHAFGAADTLVRDHALYRGLGRSLPERREAYRALFEPPVDPAFLDCVRAATNGGWALGDERFKRNLATALGRRAGPLPRGRRPKPAGDPGSNLL
jgi:putative transposase